MNISNALARVIAVLSERDFAFIPSYEGMTKYEIEMEKNAREEVITHLVEYKNTVPVARVITVILIMIYSAALIYTIKGIVAEERHQAAVEQAAKEEIDDMMTFYSRKK